MGKWYKNKRRGLGKYFYINGEKFIGYWDDDRKHGRGRQFYPDGEWFVGNFYRGS